MLLMMLGALKLEKRTNQYPIGVVVSLIIIGKAIVLVGLTDCCLLMNCKLHPDICAFSQL